MDDIKPIDSIGSQLCLTCGICCQGIIFYHDLDPEKYGILPDPSNPLLPLACRLFREKDNRCLVHEDPRRPLICQIWRCHTLARLRRDEITLEQAQTTINNIKTRLNTILLRLPQSETPRPAFEHMQSVLDSLKLELASGDRSHLELLMDIIWLQYLISRHINPISYKQISN